MSAFSAQDFARWFESIHGYEPYAWQVRLVERILTGQKGLETENAGWPDVLDLPTGSGKTTAIDIAIYTQAADIHHAPRRIVYVVDRRAIVRQTTVHVNKIQAALLHPQGEVQERVATALRTRMAHGTPDRPPLLVAELRGGIPLDDGWASEPDIPAVLISTVDQVGSRLLFRGYGVSPRMRPIHAGLLGNDCLWLLDEVHLSRPFALTLSQLKAMQEQCFAGGIPVRNGLVQMSATPVDRSAKHFFQLDPVEDLEGNPRLRSRVKAKKHAILKELKLQGATRPEDTMIARIPKEAKQLVGKVIGVIVNRVETAVKVARGIREIDPTARVITLTGRMRPLERDAVWAEVDAYARAGRDRQADTQRVYIVSTQTIEAGADLDFDGMVTEIASMDALVQRAGRVDRRGELSERGEPASITIVWSKQHIRSKYQDPVYGDALLKTWTLLNDRHGADSFDMGPSTDAIGTADQRQDCSSPEVKTTRLAPHHLDALSQTYPEPVTQPEVAYHLHGVQESRAEVSVIWRGEMPSTWASEGAATGVTTQGVPDPGEVKTLIDQLLACPPRNTEAIALPLPAFLAWAKRQQERIRTSMQVVDIADVDRYVPKVDRDQQAQEARELARIGDAVRVLRWRGEESALVPLTEIRNGDTLIVPLDWGGIREGNWDSEATDRVEDLGDLAQFRRALDYAGSAPTIRLSGWFGWPSGSPKPAGSDSTLGANTRSQLRDRLMAITAYLQNLSSRHEDLSPARQALLSRFIPKRVSINERVGRDHVLVGGEEATHDGDTSESLAYYLVIGEPLDTKGDETKPLIFETDGTDTSASLIGQALTLDQHSDDVATEAIGYANSLGIEPLGEALRLAGSFHDIGKADPRFQVVLHGGDEVSAAMSEQYLAKSQASPRNGAHALAILEQSGYPQGTRHEMLSLALIENLPAGTVGDADLVKHLVVTHHGYCRPLPPRQIGSVSLPVSVTREGLSMEATTSHGLDDISAGIPERFWQMTDRFGWYGLAWLEAILRLADHRASAMRAVPSVKKGA